MPTFVLPTFGELVPVITAVIISTALGMLWYSPMVFGNLWMELAGISSKKGASPAKAMTICFVLTIVYAYFLMTLIRITNVHGWQGGLTIGLLVWVFVGSTLVIHGMFGGKKSKLMAITVSHEFVNALLMGAVIGMWN